MRGSIGRRIIDPITTAIFMIPGGMTIITGTSEFTIHSTIHGTVIGLIRITIIIILDIIIIGLMIESINTRIQIQYDIVMTYDETR
jgi:hypothetical protein